MFPGCAQYLSRVVRMSVPVCSVRLNYDIAKAGPCTLELGAQILEVYSMLGMRAGIVPRYLPARMVFCAA